MGMVLLRYGEVALKGANRRIFVRHLRRNIRDCLRVNGIEGQVEAVHQRLYVYTDQVEQALAPLSRIFGLTSLSPVDQVACDIEAIVAACLRAAEKAGIGPATTFRVRARRSDKTFPYTSPEINRLAAEAICRRLDGKVDLSNRADVTIGVEVSHLHALVFGHSLPAPGGLPLGTGGRVVALLSGGIDSPVAAWLMAKRGCNVIPVHFCQSEIEEAKVRDNIEVLASYSYGWRLRPLYESHQQTIGPALAKLDQLGFQRWGCLFCKRALLQRAVEIAREYGAIALVMGDSLGQVASQTLSNLAVISHGIDMPILRPLIGLDKGEIIDLARSIGTFDISTREAAPCPYLPSHPVTRGTVDKLLAIEEQMALLG
jgi:thiamine biosynthesis protein ThiI